MIRIYMYFCWFFINFCRIQSLIVSDKDTEAGDSEERGPEPEPVSWWIPRERCCNHRIPVRILLYVLYSCSFLLYLPRQSMCSFRATTVWHIGVSSTKENNSREKEGEDSRDPRKGWGDLRESLINSRCYLW